MERERRFRFPEKAKHGCWFGPNRSDLGRPLNNFDQVLKSNLDGSQKVVFEQRNQDLGIAKIATSPDHSWLCVATVAKRSAGDRVAASNSVGLTFVSLHSGEYSRVTTEGVPALMTQFSQDSREFFTVTGQYSFEAREVPSGNLVASIANVFGVEQMLSMKVSDSGNHLAVGGVSGAIRLTSLMQRKTLYRLDAGSKVLDLYFSPDEDTLVAACGEHDDGPNARGEIRFFDLESGQTIVQLGRDLHTCIGFAFTPDELQMATVHFNGRIHVWEGASDEEVEWQRTPLKPELVEAFPTSD